MPIIDRPVNSQPLSQGDILQNVNLYATKDFSSGKGGDSVRTEHKDCMVLSRSCVAEHKRSVIVAAVEKYPDSPPRAVQSFDDVRKFLVGLRDGRDSPDRFYLGQLPGRQGRFCARLDAVHCIEKPAGSDQLADFLRDRRIGSLNGDFVRDLHLRIFTTFASLGFDDHSWLSDQDLTWLVESGKRDLATAKADCQEEVATRAKQEADGGRYEGKNLTKAENQVKSLDEKLQPLLAEQARREGADRQGDVRDQVDTFDDPTTA